jgi:large subunit ribosomal protein L19
MEEDIRMNLKPGMIVKVHQTIKEKNAKGEDKERIQIFEGMILATKHGNEPGATITVRKVSKGIGVEKIFPIHSPVVAKIELVRELKVRQSRAYYLRDHKKKLKEIKQPKATKKAAPKKEEKKEEAAK